MLKRSCASRTGPACDQGRRLVTVALVVGSCRLAADGPSRGAQRLRRTNGHRMRARWRSSLPTLGARRRAHRERTVVLHRRRRQGARRRGDRHRLVPRLAAHDDRAEPHHRAGRRRRPGPLPRRRFDAHARRRLPPRRPTTSASVSAPCATGSFRAAHRIASPRSSAQPGAAPVPVRGVRGRRRGRPTRTRRPRRPRRPSSATERGLAERAASFSPTTCGTQATAAARRRRSTARRTQAAY